MYCNYHAQALLRDKFNDADSNHDGCVSREEFVTSLQALDMGLSVPAIHVIYEAADTDGNGELNFEEFLPAVALMLGASEVPDASAEAD